MVKKLTFSGGRESSIPVGQVKLTLYSDSDWDMECTDMKSYTGNVVYLNGDLVA